MALPAESLLEAHSAFAIDLDGVVWRGEAIMPRAGEVLAAIKAARKPLLLLSNNASYTHALVQDKLSVTGVAIEPHEVMSSLHVAREWLESEGLKGARTIMLAPPDVVAALSDVVEEVPPVRGETAQVVLVARDINFSFERLAAAADAVRAGAAFLAVNKDVTLPAEDRIDPGTGSFLAAVEAASGRRAIVLGKPEAPMMDAAARRLGKDGVLMVGDRLESDIAGARYNGWAAALALSGVTGLADHLKPEPDYLVDSIGGILEPPRPFSTPPRSAG